jgi:hypothetical protein
LNRNRRRCAPDEATAWAREKVYKRINYRVNHNLPTVRTSNWTEREFAQVHGRIASRLKAAVHVHLSAPDARGKDRLGSAVVAYLPIYSTCLA